MRAANYSSMNIYNKEQVKEINNIVINDVILEKQNNSVKEYIKELRNKYQIEILADLNEISD